MRRAFVNDVVAQALENAYCIYTRAQLHTCYKSTLQKVTESLELQAFTSHTEAAIPQLVGSNMAALAWLAVQCRVQSHHAV